MSGAPPPLGPPQPALDAAAADRRRQTIARYRADSSGSTRGAFGSRPQGPPPTAAAGGGADSAAGAVVTPGRTPNAAAAALALDGSPSPRPTPAKRTKKKHHSKGKKGGKQKGTTHGGDGAAGNPAPQVFLPPGQPAPFPAPGGGFNLADAAALAMTDLGGAADFGSPQQQPTSQRPDRRHRKPPGSENGPPPHPLAAPKGASGGGKGRREPLEKPPTAYANHRQLSHIEDDDEEGSKPSHSVHSSFGQDVTSDLISNLNQGIDAQTPTPPRLDPDPTRSRQRNKSTGVDASEGSLQLMYSDATIPHVADSGNDPLFGSRFMDSLESGQGGATASPPSHKARGRRHPPAHKGSFSSPFSQGNRKTPPHKGIYDPATSDKSDEIADFAAMALGADTPGGYGATTAAPADEGAPQLSPARKKQAQAAPQQQPQLPRFTPPRAKPAQDRTKGSPYSRALEVTDEERSVESRGKDKGGEGGDGGILDAIWGYVNPRQLLGPETFYDELGDPYTEEPIGYVASCLRQLLYNPEVPEFTSLQQFSWAVLIGIFMGVFTALWGYLIEGCVDFMYSEVPERLLEWGLFTELDGGFPLPHYMWICPAVFGGALACITVILPKPIPGQNEWIQSLHSRGVQDHETFLNLILVSTAGMASGLSLGPELPLVLASGMAGSYLAVITKQSILSARVINLTAASAAIGGFFGFPMAGALFVLELPHRMGLQYFEALSPATIASIVAVLVNRLVTRNDVTGYFNYPFLTATLPSRIFYVAVLYGLVGSFVGVVYAEGVKKLKMVVHDLFHHHDDHGHGKDEAVAQQAKGIGDVNGKHDHGTSETIPLVGTAGLVVAASQPSFFDKIGNTFKKVASFSIKHEPTRAAVVGVIAGILTGVINMFVPHSAFWGEAQLQTLIDKGSTPLPIFGQGDDPTADLTAYGYCLIDPEDENVRASGFSMGCLGLITVTKILTIGLSLGTGIVGGQFWGPLYVGAAASHFFTDAMVLMTRHFGFGQELSQYPCVAILCIMGSAHVVTFRAHMAIMLILTLTISAFSPEQDSSGGYSGGDYSAVFPLLVVSCFVSLMITRSTVFYKEQRCRGDIIASPEVLCEPGKEGQPMVVGYDEDEDEYEYDGHSFDDDEYNESSYDEDSGASVGIDGEDSVSKVGTTKTVETGTTSDDIERAFMEQMQANTRGLSMAPQAIGGNSEKEMGSRGTRRNSEPQQHGLDHSVPAPFKSDGELPPSKRLDELLAMPFDNSHRRKKSSHRRHHSTSDIPNRNAMSGSRMRSNSSDKRPPGARHSRNNSIDKSINGTIRERASSSRASSPNLMRVTSFGEIADFQPSLMNQARKRASSVTRPPSLPKASGGRHSRKNSESSLNYGSVLMGDAAGALTQDDVERSFSSVLNQQNLGNLNVGNL